MSATATTPTPAGADDTTETLKLLQTVKAVPATPAPSTGSSEAASLPPRGEEEEENIVTKIDEVCYIVNSSRFRFVDVTCLVTVGLLTITYLSNSDMLT